ncbi:MAG TPA: hypothetical protein DCP63_15170 [Bacteroidetes bacterium]|nr:hypothetical protein [Bacteroidota bacterium]
MTMKKHRIGYIILLFVSLCRCTLIAQVSYDLGGLPGAATRLGFGARGIGMANTLTAVKNIEAVGYYNPALTPFQTSRTALISVGFLPFDRHLNALNYSQSLRPSGGMSIGILNAGVSNLEGRNRDGRVTETYSTSENVGIFSFGTKVSEEAALGISAKIFYHSLFEGVKSTTVGFDLGFVYLLSEEWTIGIVVQDINSKYKWDTSQLYGRDGNTTTERFPLRTKLAFGYRPYFLGALLTSEFESAGSVSLARFGIEVPFSDGVELRGGIDQISFGRDIDAKPSIGFSLRAPVETLSPSIDYAFVIEPYSTDGLHLLSLRLRFE